jgi:hypothetical protein
VDGTCRCGDVEVGSEACFGAVVAHPSSDVGAVEDSRGLAGGEPLPGDQPQDLLIVLAQFGECGRKRGISDWLRVTSNRQFGGSRPSATAPFVCCVFRATA